jgi:hypothetical protein
MTPTTPWGRASVVEEVAVPHSTGDRSFEAVVQLLETREGEQLVRFGARRRAGRRLTCLTLRSDELHELEEALIETERLATILRLVFG